MIEVTGDPSPRRSLELRLRPLRVTDAGVLSAWAMDPLLCAHAGWTPREQPDANRSWWVEAIRHPDPLLTRFLVVSGEEPLGYVDLHGDAVDARELGYLIAPSGRWGRGLGTAAARAGLRHAFDVLGLERVWAEAVGANVASVRVLEKIGMRRTGHGDMAEFLDDISRYVRFEITRAQWRRTPVPR